MLRIIGGPYHGRTYGQRIDGEELTVPFAVFNPLPTTGRMDKDASASFNVFTYQVFQWNTGYGGACFIPKSVPLGREMDYILRMAAKAPGDVSEEIPV